MNFHVEVCAEANNLALVLQWIKRSKDLINPKSITGKDISDYEELDLMMEAELKWCYDIVFYLRNYRAYSRDKTKKWKTIGSCSRRDACSFLHTHATGDREDNVE